MSIVFIGDVVAIFLFTLLGFASHHSLAGEGIALRFSATFFPWLVSYLLIGKRLDVFDVAAAGERAVIWQAALAMLLASPLAAVLRGFWLNRDVSPVFVAVMAGVSSLVIVLWRAAYVLWIANR